MTKKKAKKRVPWSKWRVPPGQPALSVTPAERKLVELMAVAKLADKLDLVAKLQKTLGERLEKRLNRRRAKQA